MVCVDMSGGVSPDMPFKSIEEQRAYQKAYHTKWYADPENAASKKANAKKHRKISLQRNVEFWEQYKSTLRCSRCPEDHPACLDFHHTDDNKEYDVSYMIRAMCSIEKIKAEIAKCIVLCKNCHAKHHDEERQKQRAVSSEAAASGLHPEGRDFKILTAH